MHTLLMEKKFTNGADREVVVKLYTNVAERCIYPAKMLDYYGMGFGDEEMKVLCEWFPKCEEVETLILQNNAFTATGWDLLAEVVGREGAMPKLKRILSGANKDPSAKLREACEKRAIALMILSCFLRVTVNGRHCHLRNFLRRAQFLAFGAITHSTPRA